MNSYRDVSDGPKNLPTLARADIRHTDKERRQIEDIAGRLRC